MVLKGRVVPWTTSHGLKYEIASSTVEETVDFPVRKNSRYTSGTRGHTSGIHDPISFAEQLVECRSGGCPVGRATEGGSHLSKVESKGEERYTPVHPHERCQPQGQTELEMTTLAWVGN